MSKLKEIREKAGITQAQLAQESEVSIRMIQHYEQGAKDINKAQAITVYKLSCSLKCDMKDILEVL